MLPPQMPCRLLLLALISLIVVGCAGGSSGPVSAEDLPAALREADQLLGAVDAAMAKCPEAPASSLQIPPSIIERVRRDSFFDPKVRSWVQMTIRAQEKLNACTLPAVAEAIPKAERARQLAHRLEPTDDVSPDFVEPFGSVASRTQDWVAAEGSASSQLEDAITTLRGALDAFGAFKRDIEAGAFANDTELQLALQERLSPYLRAIRDAQAEALKLRGRGEDAVSALNRAEQALDNLVNTDDKARAVADALAVANPGGYFAQGAG